MKKLIKKLLRENLEATQSPIGQEILGHKITDIYRNEADRPYDKVAGFLLDGHIILGLKGLEYNEDIGKYIVDNNTKIIYEDETEYMLNDLYPNIYNPEDIERHTQNAIFNNKRELTKFYNLLKYPNLYLLFKTTFKNVVTKDAIAKPAKEIDTDRYRDYTFIYKNKEYTLNNIVNKDGSISLDFKTKDSNQSFTEHISLYISYEKNPLGQMRMKPRVSISHMGSFPSKYEDIKTNALDPLINDILKQIK
jgi:hypothetical protein